MSIELLADIEKLDSELTLLQGNEKNQFIIEEYQAIAKKVTNFSEPIRNLELWPRLFGSIKKETENESIHLIENEITSGLKSLSLCADSLVCAWEEHDYKLEQQDVLDDFHLLLKSIIEQSEQLYQSLWKEWCNYLKSTFEVEDAILENQKNNPELKHLYDDYTKYNDSFDLIANTFPSESNSIVRLSSIANQLSEIRSKMDFSDVPEEVSEFLKQITKLHGTKEAPLSMMTEQVFKWLKEQEQLERYVVKRK